MYKTMFLGLLHLLLTSLRWKALTFYKKKKKLKKNTNKIKHHIFNDSYSFE